MFQQSDSAENATVEDVFSLLSKILKKHLTAEQSEKVLHEFKKVIYYYSK